MGRPSKLTDSQWAKIEERLLKGESTNALAREYGVSHAAISNRFKTPKHELKALAAKVAEVETEFNNLPFTQQRAVRNLADDLKDISLHLASAAKYGAMTAHRLSSVAQIQAERVSDVDPLGESAQELQAVGVLTKGANDAAQIGINLIKANQDAVQRANKDAEQPPAPKQIVFNVQDGKKTNADA